tara:strand:- start:5342 stop:5767 length:426 start_codon:yes stop_codon:yes gene_type:complete
MFGMIKMLPLLLIIAGGAYMYHTQQIAVRDATIAQQQINVVTLQNNQVKLETALEQEQKSREQAENNLQTQLKAVGELTSKNAVLASERDEYLSIFKRHDMTRLARAKPGLIEPRINKGTAEVFRQIEEDSKEIADADQDS